MSALIVKNFTLKLRRWPETLWELMLPFGCGVFAGILAVDPFILEKGYTDCDLFKAISAIYLIAQLVISLSYIGTT